MKRYQLTNQQKIFLDHFSKTKELSDKFYFSGGTALSHYYLKHRFSEDLDFFNEHEFEAQSVTVFIKKAIDALGFDKFDYQQSFNRNIYHLLRESEQLKVEFTYYPFEQIEKPKTIDGIRIDSLIDIAANKVFTIYQNPRGRDYYDLYFIVQKTGWSLEELITKAKIKFDWHVDALQLGSQLVRFGEFKDDPILAGDTRIMKEVEEFARNLALSLKQEVLE